MKKVPNLRFKEFSGEWESSKLDYVSTHIGDGIHATPEYVDISEISFINGNNIKGNKIIINESTKFISEKELKKYKVNLNNNSILMSINGTIGNIGYYNNEKVLLGKSVAYININPKIINKFFLGSLLETNKIQRKFMSELTGTTIKNLSLKSIRNCKLNFPSIGEQEKISSFLSLIDKKIELQTEKLEELKNYKKGLMQKIFSQELRFKDDNGNEYPEWYLVYISNLLRVPEKRKEENVEKEKLLTVKLHRQGVCKNNNTDTLEIGATVYYKRKSGQLIYGKQNLFNGAIDIIPDYLDGYLSSGDVPALDINVEKVIPQFLLYLVGRTSFYKPLEALASGTGSKRIHEDTLLNIKVCIPSKLEQEKITKVLGALDFKIEKEQAKLESLNQYKKGLLQQMFI